MTYFNCWIEFSVITKTSQGIWKFDYIQYNNVLVTATELFVCCENQPTENLFQCPQKPVFLALWDDKAKRSGENKRFQILQKNTNSNLNRFFNTGK